MVPIVTGRSGVLVTNPVLRKLSPFGSRLGNTDKSIVFLSKREGKKVRVNAGETGRGRSWSYLRLLQPSLPRFLEGLLLVLRSSAWCEGPDRASL